MRGLEIQRLGDPEDLQIFWEGVSLRNLREAAGVGSQQNGCLNKILRSAAMVLHSFASFLLVCWDMHVVHTCCSLHVVCNNMVEIII